MHAALVIGSFSKNSLKPEDLVRFAWEQEETSEEELNERMRNFEKLIKQEDGF